MYSDHPVLLAAASRWAQMVILSQTPAPLLWHVQRVPMELRGVSCIQDLPSHVTRGSAFIDTVVLQQQAEQLYELLLQLLQQSISGYNDAGKAKAPFLMRVLGSVARQRPAMLAPAVDIFKKILQQRKDVLGDQSFAEVGGPVRAGCPHGPRMRNVGVRSCASRSKGSLIDAHRYESTTSPRN